MKNKNFFFLLFMLSTVLLHAQNGRLLIVGGGSEKNGANSWSTPAYKWAGEGRRVAMIGTSTGSLAPYFKQQCGAAFAREFAVNSRAAADEQSLYDTLMTYQTIFFRGGDQYDYYNYYKGTKLLDAVRQIYQNGGTIGGTSAGMHILSEIVFNARLGSAYPDECIEDPFNKYITLADDFLDFVPGHLFDTHFCERGRFGRLTGFLANYSFTKGMDIVGLGMDDLTCMTIDEHGLGTVFGTGCANLYIPGSPFSQHDTKLLVDSVRVVQLLHGCTYHFKTGEIGLGTLTAELYPEDMITKGNYTVFASGTKLLQKNLALLNDLQNHTGTVTDPVLILTGDLALANLYKDELVMLGSNDLVVRQIDGSSADDPELSQLILRSPKIILLSNTTEALRAFIPTANGLLLKDKLQSDGTIAAFLGDDARFAGKTVVDNFYEEYASYYAELNFEQGFGLLDQTVIMPNTFFNSDMYENSATAVPYAMARDTLKYGIWLTDENYFRFSNDGSGYKLHGYGKAPVMVLRNEGGKAGFSSRTSTGSTSSAPRMVAGFEKLRSEEH
ncbi:MAG TPA: hypothetical protein DCX89_05810, partial [Saprospirales bacterium]|nr:hypothetical protein [Saprospirales bacterium]